ncbi:MAG: multicopper oxidase domain-containing protein, partial [Longimicrobiales bacterium]
MRFLPALLLPLCLGLSVATPAQQNSPSPPALERVSPNDNRVAAGTLRAGVLTVRLEVRAGDWRPDGDNDAGVEVLAFAEEGKALRVPGPLIRVTEGTEIRASVRNTQTDAPLIMHGLYTRGAAGSVQDTLYIAAGATREVRFTAGAPGTYFYWAATTTTATFARRGRASQLSGALIVDPRGAPTPADRVFVIGLWSDSVFLQVDDASRQIIRFVINGKSWPHTERLEHSMGDTVRWRMINTNPAVHPMHLHGFYFRVDSRGHERADTIFPRSASPRLAVTERLAPGTTAAISWVPERAGNWLFHCHDNVHIRTQLPFSGQAATALEKHVTNHTTEMMQGLVMGIHVRPRAGTAATPEPATRRRLRLVARPDPGGEPGQLTFRFLLQEGASSAQSAPASVGPPIVLRRGEPVSITVVNELPEATAVHWHGIELDSYYDGVADFSGQPGRIAPAIAPRDSFEARFTPPRAGTFIYHTHIDEVRQQRAGLAGALLVLEPGTTYDPRTDLVFLISTPRAQADQAKVFLNGTTAPDSLQLRAGTRYRIRIINIHTYRPSMRFELRQ